jgi:hypothetical protein
VGSARSMASWPLVILCEFEIFPRRLMERPGRRPLRASLPSSTGRAAGASRLRRSTRLHSRLHCASFAAINDSVPSTMRERVPWHFRVISVFALFALYCYELLCTNSTPSPNSNLPTLVTHQHSLASGRLVGWGQRPSAGGELGSTEGEHANANIKCPAPSFPRN